MIKVIDVAYPILQVPSLNKQEAFLKDFGLVTTKKTNTELYMQGLGPHKFIHKTKKGKKKLLGDMWRYYWRGFDGYLRVMGEVFGG